MEAVAAAQAIVEIAISKMSLAVREVSVAKGYDPRDFAMVASGGAGPLHAVAIARELHIPKVVVPRFPSHFSAVGMLLADERHDFIRTFYCDFASRILRRSRRLSRDGRAGVSLRHAPPLSSDTAGNGAESGHQVHLDLRYVGQEFTLQVPVSLEQLENADRSGIRTAFDALYEHRYAHHSPDEPVEMVNIRLAPSESVRSWNSRASPRQASRCFAPARGLPHRCPQAARLSDQRRSAPSAPSPGRR